MTTFRYEAARADGALVHGTLEATTVPDVTGVLSARGLYPLRVEPERRPAFQRRVSARAQATVFESLASLLEAGVPLQQALAGTERVATGSLRPAVARLGTRVREGTSLGAALAADDVPFSSVAIGLVRAGERGMGLGAALLRAAAQLEREAETAARIRAALAYPLLLLVIGCASVGLITVFIVPRFVALLGDLDQTLPPATRVLMTVSEIARQYGVMIAIIGVGAAISASRIAQQRLAAWHDWLLRLPLIGPIRHALATARAARTLGALLGTGTPALAALEIARDASGDAAMAARLRDAKARVAEGAGLAAALDATRALTPAAQQLAAIGDQSGRLPRLLAKAAELEDREAERRLKTLVGFVEPALILTFAGIVAFVAAALLQAVYSLRPS